MLLDQIVSPDVPTATKGDSLEYINSLFFASQLQQLAIVDADKYLGLIDAKDIAQYLQDPELFAEGAPYTDFRPSININAHPFEALRVMYHHDLCTLPVVNEEQEYCGALTKDGLLKYLIEHINIDVNGGIIVLSIAARNYSLAEIARICENEQVLILGVQAKANPDTGTIEVTIKTNSIDLSAVVQAFERYEYHVVDTYGDQKIENNISDRYRLLMNYINM